jgi:hypothetical protein
VRAYAKRAIVAGALAGAVFEHELSGHGVPHVEIPEAVDPYVVVGQQNLLASGENLAIAPELELKLSTPRAFSSAVRLSPWGGSSTGNG